MILIASYQLVVTISFSVATLPFSFLSDITDYDSTPLAQDTLRDMSFYQLGSPVSTMMNAFDEDDALLSLHFRVQSLSLSGSPQFVSTGPVETLSDTTVTSLSDSLTASFVQLDSSQCMTGKIAWSFISANSKHDSSNYETPSRAFRLTVSYRLSIERMLGYRLILQFFQPLSYLSSTWSYSYFFQSGASDFWARATKFLSAVIPWTPLKELGVSCGPGFAFADCSKLLSSDMKMSVCERTFDTQNLFSVGGCLSGCMCEGYVYDFKVTASFQQPFVENFEMITFGLLASSIPEPIHVTMSLRDDYNRTCMDISWQRSPSESRALK
jgi:hypothetical protein